MQTAYIALGSNLGDRRASLDFARRSLRGDPGIHSLRLSSMVETEPVGPAGQGRYLNAAAELETTLTPRGLLDLLLSIETDAGRDRSDGLRWGPRTLDLDLLVFGSAVIDEPELTVPHPRIAERMFVLEPLAELAPDLVIPTLGRSVTELIALQRHGPKAAAR
ncbi:MAG: 2-amino-4-hydroxy-6-hydroxymethyldihydropteridine diphosphokinase [Planctomycetota bacterium]